MKKIITILFLAVTVFACTSDKTETVNIKNQYSVELPSFLNKADNLHEDASLQYQNALREFYVVVIDEPKSEFEAAVEETEFTGDLEGYTNILHTSLKQSLGEANFSNIQSVTINGLNARKFTFEGTLENLPVVYQAAYIEGESHFYQIVSWTLQENKAKYQGEMQKIIESFKEMKSSRSVK